MSRETSDSIGWVDEKAVNAATLSNYLCQIVANPAVKRTKEISLHYIQDHIRKRNNICNAAVVVDLGCGVGIDVKMVGESLPSARVVGIDPNGSLLDNAREACAELKNCSFEVGRAETYSIPVADVIHFDRVLQHLHRAVVIDVFRKAHDALEPRDGCLVIVDTNWCDVVINFGAKREQLALGLRDLFVRTIVGSHPVGGERICR
jgi:SAM-dependent methyltransferase